MSFPIAARQKLPLSWLWSNRTALFAAFLFLCAVVIVLRLYAMKSVPLAPEEAYYWDYAQHPELSYFDHPPMIAWIIRAGTAIFGNTEFGVRWLSTIATLAASVVVYRFVRGWWPRETAILTAAGVLLLPGFFINGLMATMDAPLILFWALTLLFLSSALKSNRARGWYLAGITTGLALLTKYTAIFLPIGGLLAVILWQPWRRHLRTIHPYLACAIAIAIFSPVLLWNADHGLASFRFQLFGRSAQHAFGIALVPLFAMYQFVLVGPVHAIVIAVALRRCARRWSPRAVMAISFSVPLILAMGFKSFRETHPDWTLPAYLALLPLAGQLLSAEARLLRRRRQHDSGALGITAVACLSAYAAILVFLVQFQPRNLLFESFGQWRSLAAIVERYEDQLPHHPGEYAETEPFIVGDGTYRIAAELAFYRTPIEHEYPAALSTTSRWPIEGNGLGYEYWLSRSQLLGRDCIFVTDDPNYAGKLSPHFARIEAKESFAVSRHKSYKVIMCLNYLG